MERYGNIRFNRRVVVFVCLLVVAVNFLMPKHVVYADDKSYVYSLGQTFFSSEHELRSVDETEFTLNKPLYFYVAKIIMVLLLLMEPNLILIIYVLLLMEIILVLNFLVVLMFLMIKLMI